MLSETIRDSFPVASNISDGTVTWLSFDDLATPEPFYSQTVLRAFEEPARRRTVSTLDVLLQYSERPMPLKPTFVFHTSRCGSTLFANAAKNIAGALVLSEPPILSSLLTPIESELWHTNYRGSGELRDRLLRGALVAYASNGPAKKYLIVKTTSIHAPFLPLFCSLFEHSSFVFMYRNPIEVLRSNLLDNPQWLARAAEDRKTAICARNYVAAAQSALEGDPYLLPYERLTPSAVTEACAASQIDSGDVRIDDVAAAFSYYSKDRDRHRAFTADARRSETLAQLSAPCDDLRAALTVYDDLFVRQNARDMLRHVRCERAASSGAVPQLNFDSGLAGVAYSAYLTCAAAGADEAVDHAFALMCDAVEAAGEDGAFGCSYGAGPYLRYANDSILHGPSGYWMVLALLAAARNDQQRCADAVQRYVNAVSGGDALFEFAFGSAGHLWGCARMLRGAVSGRARAKIQRCGADLLERTWRALTSSIANGTAGALAFAHGRAGALFAILAWCSDGGVDLPKGFVSRLDDLACFAQVGERGVSWPASAGTARAQKWPGWRESWCNGAAGYVSLWRLAHRHLGGDLYRKLALGAASFIARRSEQCGPSLCCGVAGHATAFREAHSLDPQGPWASFAIEVLQSAVTESNAPAGGLLKGKYGALLAGIPWL